MNTVSYIRQSALVDQGKLGDTTVVVIGSGAVGSQVALSLAKMGVGHLSLWDHDEIVPHNLPNQFFRLDQVERNKAEATAENILAMADTHIDIHPTKWRGEPLKGIVVAAPDLMSVRKQLWATTNRDPNVPLFVDVRMGGLAGKLYAIQKHAAPEVFRMYEEDLHGDDVASPLACGEASIFYGATLLAACAAAVISNHVSGYAVPPFTLLDGRNIQVFRPE